eukprot:TRINITY_DN54955_c0_g1_i1.p1 TRINITY_DN54955_c0_g1~~TRINITY_DN54955_c0_g1_i1.p1  ORF type:complete len:514 (-),score=135.81 TRINITY_DN54955_c0_g1_i1:42-1583(-)
MAAAVLSGAAAERGGAAPISARYRYPRSRVLGASGAALSGCSATPRDEFQRFRDRTAPQQDDLKENVFEKSGVDPFRHDSKFMATTLSIAPPEEKPELTLRDRRARPLPAALRPAALDILEKPMRCLDRGRPPPGAPVEDLAAAAASRAPPQPIPAAVQRQEAEFIDTIEGSLRDGQDDPGLWEQYAKRAEELLITMSLEKALRVLKVFVMAKYRGSALYTHIGAELAKEVRDASSTRLCQLFHWLGRAGLRDPTLLALMGNETLLRLSDDFVVDMHIEVLNVHARLEVRSPRLIAAALRDLQPVFPELGADQCTAIAPLTVMNVFSAEARVAYLQRCAELRLGLPAELCRPSVLRQLRLLEECLRLDMSPVPLPAAVEVWLNDLRVDADAKDQVEPVPLSAVETDILRILREELDVAVTPVIQDGIFTVHLSMGRTVLEVLDSYGDYYVTPAMGGQRLYRADTKLRHRLLWRKGWRLLTLDAEEWERLTDDLYKKDLLEDLLVNGPRRFQGS